MEIKSPSEYSIFIIHLFEKPLKPHEIEKTLLWEENKVPLWVIAKAYGIMMKNCEKQSFRYFDVVLRNWLETYNKNSIYKWEDIAK